MERLVISSGKLETSRKDKNGRDLVDPEEINVSWKECTKELNKKDLYEPDDYNGWLVTQSQTL